MTELKSRRLLLMLSIGIANALWNDGPCKSDDCWKQRAREIEESLDVTIDPCDNFYAFSCGGWMKKNPAPRYYKSWTPANVYEHKMMNIFAKQRDETGFDIIESLEIIGGWPILGDKYQTPLEVIPSVILPVITKVFGVDTASNYGPAATVVGLSIRPIFGLIDTVFYISESDNVDFMTNDMKNEFLRRYYTFKMQFHNNSTTYGLSNDTILNAIILRIIEISYLEDNFGIPAAFAAYEKNKTPEDEEISLPNYPMYKDKKLFFISYASSLCTSENPKSSIDGEESFRIGRKVNIALGNMKEFSDAFSCPKNCPMNPTKKVHVFGPDDQMNSD
ncbi:hypothetical protein HCN44_006042 [Aphidius gifuensis]|uniref:Peptidase M13 C-terminal domain-containing protein n=1 Tax=Aphidius gifuensis TaxID=684658 RepID=A0A834Y6M9_APHGI|nr:hypothetical protein HCN44_006042 [Aphidius gifuensis]